jgi:predicted Zn-dependent protease
VADEVRVVLRAHDLLRVAWAHNEHPAAARDHGLSAQVACAFAKHHAAVSTRDVSQEGLQRAVARAEAMAKEAAPDPDYPGEADQAQVAPVPQAWDEATARVLPDRLIELYSQIGGDARRRELSLSGTVTQGRRVLCVATRRGFFGYHRQTEHRLELSVRQAGPAVSAGAQAVRASDVDGPGLYRRAAALCALPEGQPPPGPQAAILSADAVADLLPLLLRALDRRAVEEGRSFLARPRGDRLGQRLLGEVALRADPTHPLLAGAPFDDRGRPLHRTALIEKGAAQRLYAEPPQEKPPKGRRPAGPPPQAVVLSFEGKAREAATPEELASAMKRGLLITRLQDVAVQDGPALLVSASSAGGTFLIEDGRVTRQIGGVRLLQSLPELLGGIDQATAPVRTLAGRVACPHLRVRTLRCVG